MVFFDVLDVSKENVVNSYIVPIAFVGVDTVDVAVGYDSQLFGCDPVVCQCTLDSYAFRYELGRK